MPERVLTNLDLERMVDTSDEWIRKRTGIERRHVVADGETTSDVAAQAARQALEHAGVAPGDVDWVVVSTDTPEMGNPATACFVAGKIGATRASALDFTGGCAGFLQSLCLLETRVKQAGETILVVGAELLSRIVDWKDRATCVLFGDGAGAAVLGPKPGGGGMVPAARFLSHYARTDGSMTDILAVPYGGTRYPKGDVRLTNGDLPAIVMHGQTVFRWAVECMVDAAQTTVQRAGLKLSDIDLVIPHQANVRIIDAVASRLKLPPERLFADVAEYGNTGSASIGIALVDAVRQGRIAEGARVLLVAFGSGFTWSGSLMAFDGT